MYAYVYIHIITYIYTHIDTYTYIYIPRRLGKECGRGLLGAQTELSMLRERLYHVVNEAEDAAETLQDYDY